MKTGKLILMLIPFMIAFLFSSCNRDGANSNVRTYLDDVSGSYSGEFTTSINQTSVPGTADVTKTKHDELQIHCYSESMDTTFIMDVYENGDSLMLCNTGHDFYNVYGHMGNGYHMMDMGTGESEWMHHLHEDHQGGDEHYGSFDIEHHTFNYSFRMMDGDSGYILNFHGTKN